MIRGMNATVVHGDSLTREAKDVYFIQNTFNDHMKFSDLNVMPRNEIVMKDLDIRKWIDEPIKEHIENKEVPEFLRGITYKMMGVNE